MRVDVGRGLRALALAAVVGLASSTAALAAGELRLSTAGEPKTLDPHGVSGTWENMVVGDQFMGLMTEDAAAKPIYGAAESHTVSEDGLTYTFKLRDHNWSDGEPVTAEDFVFSLRRILDPALAAEYASILFLIKNAQPINTGEMALEELGVRAVDDKTLEITLENPAGYFPELLTHYTAFPVPKHVVEEHGAEWTKPENFVSNGPYHVVEWTPNTRVVAEKNPEFYDAENVSFDRVVYYPDEDRNTVAKRFRAGEIDFATDLASEQVDFLKRELGEAVHIYPYLGVYYYVFNNKQPPFDDVRVRQALSMAIYRQVITDKVLTTGEIPAYGVIPPDTGSIDEPYEPDWASMPYDEQVEEAKSLLEEAGYGPDNPLSVTLSYNTSENHKRIAVAVQAMWKGLGVDAQIVNREVKVHYDELQQHNFEVARAGWIADYNDPQNFLYLLETRTGPNNYAQYSNPEFDRLMQEQASIEDEAKRTELMQEAEATAMGDFAWAPIYYYVSKALVSPDLQGYEDNVKHIHRSRWLSPSEG